MKNRFTDLIFPLFGFLLIVAGFTWLYRPLGPIVAGILLITAAFLAKRNKRA